MGCRFCLSRVGGSSPGQLLWGGGQCSVSPTLCCGHTRPYVWVFVLVPESKGKIGFKLFKKLKAPTYMQIVAFLCVGQCVKFKDQLHFVGWQEHWFFKSYLVCTLLHLHLERHGAVFRRPSGLARLWVGANSFAVRTPGGFLQNRLCRAVPFAETAFPSLTPGWFLITALRNNSEATGVTVSSVQFSGSVSSQSRATVTTNDCAHHPPPPEKPQWPVAALAVVPARNPGPGNTLICLSV